MMLKINNLHYCIQHQPFFKQVNLEVKAGELIRFVGGNGSGKTTLLNLIYGHLPMSSGEKILNVNSSLNYLPQMEESFPKIYLQLKDISNRETSFYSKNLFHKNWHTASGGEKKKALLSRILTSKDNIFLLDEPFNHLDHQSIQEVEHFIHQLCKKGSSVIYTGHHYKMKHTKDLEVKQWRC